MSKWQPIETAPRDGTAVLLFTQGIENTGPMINVASFMCKIHAHLSFDRPCPSDDCEPAWYSTLCWLGGEHTHWMPLPAPPQGET